MNIIYTPLPTASQCASALEVKHWIPQLYLMEKIYLLLLYMEQSNVPDLAEGERVQMTQNLVCGTKTHSIQIGMGWLRLAEVWQPYRAQLVRYMVEIQLERQRAGTKFPPHSLYHRALEWERIENCPEEEANQFPWKEPVYGTHRAHLEQYGYSFVAYHSAPRINSQYLWPTLRKPTKLRPVPAFERLLSRLKT